MNCPQHPGQAGNTRRVTVLPPDAQGTRRIRCDGIGLGRAYGPADVLEFLRRADLDLDDVTASLRFHGRRAHRCGRGEGAFMGEG